MPGHPLSPPSGPRLAAHAPLTLAPLRPPPKPTPALARFLADAIAETDVPDEDGVAGRGAHQIRQTNTDPQQALFYAVADALLAPTFLCHRGRCRRHGLCSFAAPDGLPLCIGEAEDPVALEFGRVIGQYVALEKDMLSWNLSHMHDLIPPCQMGNRVRLCLSIAATLHAGDAARQAALRAFWRQAAVLQAQAAADGVQQQETAYDNCRCETECAAFRHGAGSALATENDVEG